MHTFSGYRGVSHPKPSSRRMGSMMRSAVASSSTACHTPCRARSAAGCRMHARMHAEQRHTEEVHYEQPGPCVEACQERHRPCAVLSPCDATSHVSLAGALRGAAALQPLPTLKGACSQNPPRRTAAKSSETSGCRVSSARAISWGGLHAAPMHVVGTSRQSPDSAAPHSRAPHPEAMNDAPRAR